MSHSESQGAVLINTGALARCEQPSEHEKLFQQFRAGKSHSVLLNFLLLILLPLSCSAANSTLSDQDLTRISFDQNLNQQISLSLPLRDEHGARLQLSSCFGNKPVILVLGYYGCPLLCTLTLNGLIESLQDLRLDAGQDFTVINVSIDPTETAALATSKKRTYLRRYGRGQNEQGWRFLTGDANATHQLANEIGFHFAYDPAIRQYAHPSGFVVLSPGGKITRYFFGVKYSARELDQALHEAAAGKTGSPIQQFLLLCFHYNPLTGKYGHLVLTIIRLSGVATLLFLAWLLTRRKFAFSSSASAFFASLRLKIGSRKTPVPHDCAPVCAKDSSLTNPHFQKACPSAYDSPSPWRERAGVRGNAASNQIVPAEWEPPAFRAPPQP
jgi:protein SCO1/2